MPGTVAIMLGLDVIMIGFVGALTKSKKQKSTASTEPAVPKKRHN